VIVVDQVAAHCGRPEDEKDGGQGQSPFQSVLPALLARRQPVALTSDHPENQHETQRRNPRQTMEADEVGKMRDPAFEGAESPPSGQDGQKERKKGAIPDKGPALFRNSGKNSGKDLHRSRKAG